ncbi:META domain-containing protein [Streptomyces niveus]|uniref:META domain-containing protein n=1 Tax=Streptomyces niveus TaxID=193462 RepID=UPI002E33206A|nr:META domain-containing protein [Streptomyces niveus]
MTTVTALTTLTLLALAGCGTETGRESDGAAEAGSAVSTDLPLTDVRWSIESLSVDGKKTAAPAGASVEIDSKGKASAQTGCNSIGAQVTIDGDTITVGEKSQTMMGCPKELEAFEKALGGAFGGKLKAKVDDKKLTLTTDGGDSIALTAEKPGNLGCNGFSASAKVAGSTITFGPLKSTKRLCPEPGMSVERELTKVLKGQVTYEVHHRELTLKAADGEGLSAGAGAAAK